MYSFFRLLVLLLVLVAGPLLAQPLSNYTTTQRARLTRLQTETQATYTKNYARAEALAKKLGRPVRQAYPNGRVVQLAGISETGELLYDHTTSNARAAATTRTSSFYAGGSLGLSLSGSSSAVQTRLGTWDGGKVRGTHVELAGRVTQQDNATANDDHATHTSGTMIALGRNPAARGMANGAKLRAWDFSNDTGEMTTAAADLLLSNHSYGTLAGWNYSSSRTGTILWEWYGDSTVSKTDDYKFGQYDSKSRSWDQIAIAAPYYLIVKSAGNSHGDNGPAAGQRYYFGSSSRTSTAARANQDGYDQIPTYGCAKNILTVGAIGIISNGYKQASDAKIAGFSSWGPTDDGRIKPDIVAAGVNVLSTVANTDSTYDTYSGTSMSGPNATGSLLLLQEYYAQRNNGKLMRASTLKGLAIHTADETGTTPGPDYIYGWGLLNMERAGQAVANLNNNYRIDEQNLAQGKTYSVTVVASGRGPLIATIAWTDPEGTATGAVLNDRTPKLINDLDLRINDGTATLLPWTMNPDAPDAPATPGDNIRDNVEQVLVQNPVPGKTYIVTVLHKGTLKNSQQDYALLLSGIGGTAYCASAPTSAAGTRLARVRIGIRDQIGSTNCTTYTDQTSSTAITVQPGQSVPFSLTVGSCDTTRRASFVRIFADWNANGSFADVGDTLATSGRLAVGGVFSANLTVPVSVAVGQFVRLRVVASEAVSATTISACGSYGNGETQDYLLQTVLTANDVATVALLSPTTLSCGSTGDALVAIRVQNLGTAPQQNLPISVRIFDAANAAVASLTGVISTLTAFGSAQIALRTPTGSPLQAGQAYRFVITTTLANDQNPANNQISVTRTIGTGSNNTGIFAASSCGTDTIVTLKNTGTGLAYWYDAATGGNLITIGNQATARVRLTNQTLYATQADFTGRIGPATKYELGGGSYGGGFIPQPLIKTETPLLLESARLYIGAAGRLTFSVKRLNETVISSVTLDVLPTRSASVTGTTADDLNDPGAEYALNLAIPQAGQYKIVMDYEDGATIYRSNVGVTGFPYQLKDQSGNPLVTIRGSLFANTNSIDTLTTAWYYLYNLRVRSLACPVATRTAVTVVPSTIVTAAIRADGSTNVCRGGAVTLQASVPASASGLVLSYRWQQNGQAISGATNTSLLVSLGGSYAVQVTGSCAPTTSSAVVVSVRDPQTPTVTQTDLVLASNAASGNQWLLNGVPISGATSNSFVVGQTGKYSVQANVNGCGTAISQEILVTILATENEPDNNLFTIYPNPARDLVTVEVALSGTNPEPPTVSLTDLRGVVLRTAPMQRDGKKFNAILSVADLPGGTFFVVISATDAENTRRRRLIKP